jgi:hypothetical protein
MQISTKVAKVQCFIIGFECDSISGLNNHRAENDGCVEAATGKTGSTCQAHLAACRPHAQSDSHAACSM